MAPTPPPHIQTLDVRMMSAAVVAIGQVVDYQLNAERKWDVRISVSEVLKGRAGSLLTVELAPSETRRRTTVATQTILAAWTQSAATLLLAVTPNQKGAPMVVELTDPELAVMTADLELLRTPEAVIAAAKAIIQQVPGVAPPPTFGLAVELRRVVDTPLDTRSGYSMSSNFLFADVPVDARLEARARGRIEAGERERRINAVQALGLFRSPANITLLRPLLDDEDWRDTFVESDGGRLLRQIQYNDIRREVYAVLRRMGAAVSEPETSRPRERDDQVIAVALDERPVTSGDLRELDRYANLECLYLASQMMTPDQWAAVGRFSGLRELYLEGSNVSDAGLAGLSVLHRLRYLGLGNTGITDAGLQALAAFPGLKKVDLGQGVTPDGVAALRRARPDITVREDEFAFLAPLRPRRVDQPFARMRNFFVGSVRTPDASGFRVYGLVFPKETARQIDAVLARELPVRGWTSPLPPPAEPRYRRESAPVVPDPGVRHEDQVLLRQGISGFPPVAPGERMIVVAMNVDPGPRQPFLP